MIEEAHGSWVFLPEYLYLLEWHQPFPLSRCISHTLRTTCQVLKQQLSCTWDSASSYCSMSAMLSAYIVSSHHGFGIALDESLQCYSLTDSDSHSTSYVHHATTLANESLTLARGQ